jgi:hypothetical protein
MGKALSEKQIRVTCLAVCVYQMMEVGKEVLCWSRSHEAGSLKMNTTLEYSTRVVQEGGRRCKKSTLNDLVHLTPLRIPLMNPPLMFVAGEVLCAVFFLKTPPLIKEQI